MFGSIGGPEIILGLLVIVLLFGVGKISGLGKDLGTSIREFRRAVKDDDDESKKDVHVQQAQVPPAQPTQQPPQAQQQDQPKSNLF
jgi:sec-independent protein translocase protein TatA